MSIQVRQVNRASLLLGAVMLAGTAGCDWPTDSGYRAHLSAVSEVSVPDSVALGARFTVAIDTWGPNGCWRKGDDSVSRTSPMLVRITPHDREPTGEGVCTDNIMKFRHVVPITGTARGDLEIEVRTRLRSVSGKDSAGVIAKTVYVY